MGGREGSAKLEFALSGRDLTSPQLNRINLSRKYKWKLNQRIRLVTKEKVVNAGILEYVKKSPVWVFCCSLCSFGSVF